MERALMAGAGDFAGSSGRDVLVRGGVVADGTGRVLTADGRVRGGMIAEVGARLAPDGEAVLDAGGAVVAPGFLAAGAARREGKARG